MVRKRSREHDRRRRRGRGATPLLACFLAIFLAGPSFAQTPLSITAEGQRVIVRAEAGLEKLAAKSATSASESLRRIETDLADLPRVDRVEVRLVKHARDLAAHAPAGRGAPEWAVGTAYPDSGVVLVAAIGRNGELLDAPRTLTHELAHMALDKALGGTVPRWLTEGFAYLHSSDFSWERAATLSGAVIGRRLVRLRELEGAFPARESAVALAYAESYDFASFLAQRGRWPDSRDDGSRVAFQQFLAELARGRGMDAALTSAFGRTLDQLEQEWSQSLEDRYFWIPVGLGGATLWTGAALLLFLGYLRRKRQMKRRLGVWEIQEALDDSQRLAEKDRLN